MAMPRKTGTVKLFHDMKGYGFIEDDDGGNDVFVHYTDIAGEDDHRSLMAGERVEFSLFDQSVRGPKATDVLKI